MKRTTRDIDPALLHDGTNDIHVDLDGFVQLDRLHTEISFTTEPPRRRSVGVHGEEIP